MTRPKTASMNDPAETDTSMMPDLGERLKQGETDAFETFLRVFPRRFYFFFFRKGLSPVDAEQLAEWLIQEILLNKLAQYRPGIGGGFDAWCKTLTRHAWIDWCRKGIPEFVSFRDELKCPTNGLRQEGAGTGEKSQETQAVRDALCQMEESDIEILDMHDVRKLGFAEIGAAFGIPEGTARVRHFRAKKRLLEVLEKDARIAARISKTQKE